MSIEPGLMLTGMLVIGFLCQWAAWRVKLPAIVFLLLAGLLLGPVSGLLQPDKVLGDLLFPVVSLSVAVILFEGSLTLRFSELPGIGSAVRGLVTYGALLTLALMALAAHWVAGVGWPIALLFGALTCVTGPTVIVPMLRTLRPNTRIANTLRWEGIVIDPLGALFAVLIFEAVMTHEKGHTIGRFVMTVGWSVLIGLVAGRVLGFLLRRQLIPEYLQTYGVLALVLLVFVGSNLVFHESGLLTVTIMGIALGNMRGVHIDEILDFKEHLTTLLVSLLFVLLAARLPWPLPGHLLWEGGVIFVIAQVLVRPLVVLLSSAGSTLNWRERALIGWVAPRGIVAASVTAVFALRLQAQGVAGADALVPLVFIIIIGTVVLQSATARPLALWLKVAEPEPHGVLIYGSDTVARGVGKALAEAGFQVMLADEDHDGIRRARMEGLPTFFGNPVSPLAERNLDLTGIGRLLAMTTHRERNTLACVHYRQEFGREKVYRLRVLTQEESTDRMALAGRLQAPPLFDGEMTHARFAELLTRGWQIKSTKLSATFDWPHFVEQHSSECLLLFGVEEKGTLRVASAKRELEPRPGWTVIVLVPPNAADMPEPAGGR